MNKQISSYIILVVLLVGTVGCKKFLDVAPDNIGTIDYAFRMRTEAEKYLFTCYNNLPRWSEFGTDPGFFTGNEFATPYPNALGMDIGIYRIARGEQNIVNPIANYWDGTNGGRPYFKALRECNIFLEKVGTVPDLAEFEKRRWIAEVKFLKAYFHYFLMRMYGPIPLIRESLPISASIDEVRTFREPVDSVVSYISSLIDEALPGLPDKIGNEASELGRITKPIALAVKAQALVTAASPLFNGNPDYASLKNGDGTQLVSQSYDAQKWVKAAEACREAIEAAHAQGAELYHYLPAPGEIMSDSTRVTMSIRAALSDKWNAETIWGASSSQAGYTLQRYAQARLISGDPGAVRTPPATNDAIGSMLAPPLHIVEMFYSNNGVPIEEDKDYDYANRLTRLRTAQEDDRFYLKQGYTTVQLNFDREPRFYADLGFDGGVWYGQGLYNDSKTWHMEAKSGQLGAKQQVTNFTVTGYLPKKLVNYKNDFGSNSAGYNVIAYPWPVIRLAEMYLLYAEALNEANGPGDEVFTWIDQVRARAGLKGVVESWSDHAKNPAKPSTKEGLREIIQRETMIELVFEGKRIWDIRRWKIAGELMSKPVSGWDIDQETVGNYYRVRQLFTPLFNTRDYLWPISENSIVVNQNLVQNPGW